MPKIFGGRSNGPQRGDSKVSDIEALRGRKRFRLWSGLHHALLGKAEMLDDVAAYDRAPQYIWPKRRAMGA